MSTDVFVLRTDDLGDRGGLPDLNTDEGFEQFFVSPGCDLNRPEVSPESCCSCCYQVSPLQNPELYQPLDPQLEGQLASLSPEEVGDCLRQLESTSPVLKPFLSCPSFKVTKRTS